MSAPTDSTTGSAASASPAEHVAPIRREITVPVPVETAFALFTAHIGAWWPLRDHSVHGARGIVAFEGDQLVERAGTQSCVWAEVVSWDPPASLRLSWHPGSDLEHATDLQVSFTDIAGAGGVKGAEGGTLVTVVHSGWERTTRPTEAAQSYGEGWPSVLGSFATRLANVLDGPFAPPDLEDEAAGDEAHVDEAQPDPGTWFALVHTPGPALPEGGSIFAHPMFAEHLAFLDRLKERGLLVAAGPVVPERGEGMTVIRVLPEHGDIDVEQLASADDRSVAGGYLQVEVRPWSVRFTG